MGWSNWKNLQCTMREIRQFPECLVHFVLLLLFVVARFFFKPGARFISKNYHEILLGLSQILPHLILFKNA